MRPAPTSPSPVQHLPHCVQKKRLSASSCFKWSLSAALPSWRLAGSWVLSTAALASSTLADGVGKLLLPAIERARVSVGEGCKAGESDGHRFSGRMRGRFIAPGWCERGRGLLGRAEDRCRLVWFGGGILLKPVAELGSGAAPHAEAAPRHRGTEARSE